MSDSATVVSQFRPASGELPPISAPKDMPTASIPRAQELYFVAGYSKEQIDAAFAGHVPAADKSIGPIHGERDGVPLSQEQLNRSYQGLFENWRGDPQEILRAAKAAGAVIKDAKGQAINAADAAIGRTYELTYSALPNISEIAPEEMKAFDDLAQGAGRALGLSQHVLQQAVEAFYRTADAVPDIIDDQAMATKMEVEGSVIRGLSDGSEVIRLAAIATEAIKKSAPDFYKLLVDSWAMHSAAAQLALSNIGREIERKKA